MQKQAATARRDIEGRRLDIAEEELGLSKTRVASDLLKILNKDERTNAIKNYEFHVEQAKAAGETPKSFANWEKGLTRERELYDEAVASGLDPTLEENKFHNWLFRLKKAGATRITLEGRREVAEQAADISTQKKFRDPKYRTDTIKAVIGDPFDPEKAFMTAGKFKTDAVTTSAEKQKIAMRKKVFNDVIAANPGRRVTKREIGGGKIGTGVIISVDGVVHTTWNDPEVSELKIKGKKK